MNMQRVSSVSFGDIYYENIHSKYYKPTTNQKKLWQQVSSKLDPYVTDIVPTLEEKADVDVVLFFNKDGSATLKLKDTFDKFTKLDKSCDNADLIDNVRSPKIKTDFFNREMENYEEIEKKLDNFIERCRSYLKIANN